MLKEIPNAEIFNCVIDSINNGDAVQLRVRGNSMYPCLREGDIVLLSPFEDAEIKPGVVVLFAYGESHLLHRVIFRKDDKLIIQGDNVFSHVEKVKMNNVIAVMKQYSKKNGKVISSDSCVWKLCLLRNRIRKQIKKMILTIKDI